MRLVFGGWEPDKPPHLSGALVTCRNVYPGPNGYRPLKQFVPTTGGTLPAPCLGADSFTSPQGMSSIIAGTQTGLYRARLNGWKEIGSGYGAQADGRWRYAQFGGLAIATNGSDPMVKINLTSFVTAPLGGSPPKTKLLAVVKDFLVGGVLNGDTQTLGWSGINDAEFWTFGQNQSDYQIMPSGGDINGLFGGEYGLVLQRSRISRMTYVGDNLVFQFDEISSNVGCATPNSVAQWGALGFFLSDTGFMMWDGSSLRPIGQERVDRTFLSLYAHTSLSRMTTAIDPINNIVAWSMQDRTFVYNWSLDRWSMTDAPITTLFSGVSRDIALDELDQPFPILDGIPYSLDDPYFKGGDPRFYVVDNQNRLGTLTGDTMQVEFGGAKMELTEGREARIQMVRPLSDVEYGINLVLRTSQRLGAEQNVSVYSGITDSGDMMVRDRGRFAQIDMTLDAGANFGFMQGVDVVLARGAKR